MKVKRLDLGTVRTVWQRKKWVRVVTYVAIGWGLYGSGHTIGMQDAFETKTGVLEVNVKDLCPSDDSCEFDWTSEGVLKVYRVAP